MATTAPETVAATPAAPAVAAPTPAPVAAPAAAAEPKAKITLHWLEQSRSQRILWLLEELNLPYELKTYKRQKSGLADPELKKVHPLGKSPVITVEVPGFAPIVLAESGLISEYLVDHFGPHLKPAQWQAGKENQPGGETESYLRYRYLIHYNEGTLMPLLVVALLFGNVQRQSPFFVKPIVNGIVSKIEQLFLGPNFKANFQMLESMLTSSPNGGQFLCGDKLTAADILMSFPLMASKGRAGLTKAVYPKIWDYVDRLSEEGGFKKSVQKIIEVEGEFKASL